MHLAPNTKYVIVTELRIYISFQLCDQHIKRFDFSQQLENIHCIAVSYIIIINCLCLKLIEPTKHCKSMLLKMVSSLAINCQLYIKFENWFCYLGVRLPSRNQIKSLFMGTSIPDNRLHHTRAFPEIYIMNRQEESKLHKPQIIISSLKYMTIFVSMKRQTKKS